MKKTVTLCVILLFVVSLIVIHSRDTKNKPDSVRPVMTEPVHSHKDIQTMALSGAHDSSMHSKKYASNTVVITNDVLTSDSRKQVKTSSDEWKQHKKALNDAYYTKGGARTKVTFHVVDVDGNSVPDADIGSDIYGPDKKQVRGKTDSDGLFISEGRLIDELVYSASKDGYYKTRSVFRFTKRGVISFENGRNIPWNPTLRVTLKDIRNPIPMYVKRAKIIFPARGEFFHYDFLAGDLVEPHGKGKVPDIAVMYTVPRSESLQNCARELVIRTMADGDGFILKQKDKWSALMCEHTAPETGYSPEINLYSDRMPGKPSRLKESTADEYHIFRSRTQVNGGVTESHYGRIWGKIGYGSELKDTVSGELFFYYYFNPTPNDRNLEFDGKSNLFYPDWKDYDWPKDP